MTRTNVRGAGRFHRRHKTGQEVDLPILPEVASELAQMPPKHMMLIAHGEKAQGYDVASFGNWKTAKESEPLRR